MLEKNISIVLHTVHTTIKITSHISIQRNTEECRMPFPQTQGRKSKSQRPLFTPFSILDIESDYKPGRDIQKIKEVRPAEILQQIHYDPVKNSIALFLSEFLSRTIREPEANPVFLNFYINQSNFLISLKTGKRIFIFVF